MEPSFLALSNILALHSFRDNLQIVRLKQSTNERNTAFSSGEKRPRAFVYRLPEPHEG
jgi:hypothetical protein